MVVRASKTNKVSRRQAVLRFLGGVALGLVLTFGLLKLRVFLIIEQDVFPILEADGYHDIVPMGRTTTLDLYRGCKIWDGAAFNVTASDYKERRYDLKVCVSWPLPGSSVHPQ